MKRITCCECKKVYNYEQDEFCPRCGAYNPVNGQRGFSDHAHLNGARASIPSSKQLQKDDPVSTAAKNFLYSSEFQQAVRPAAYATYYRSHPKRLLILVVVLVAILAALVVNLIRAEGNVSGEPETVTHEFGSAFQVAGKQVTLSNPRWVDLPDEFLNQLPFDDYLNNEEYCFLAVDARISTVDAEQSSPSPEIIWAAFADGNGAKPFESGERERWKEDVGLDIISLSDASYINTTLSGQIVFSIERAYASDTLSFTIPEYGRSGLSGHAHIKDHTLSLDLDDLPYAVLPTQT